SPGSGPSHHATAASYARAAAPADGLGPLVRCRANARSSAHGPSSGAVGTFHSSVIAVVSAAADSGVSAPPSGLPGTTDIVMDGGCASRSAESGCGARPG